MAAFIFSKTPASLSILFVFIGFLSSSTYVASLLYGVSGTSERARRMAVHESLLALGVISGSTVGGWIYQSAGMEYAYGLLIALLSVGLAAQAVILDYQRRTRKPRVGG
jgi:predicted MFS family arabinose efflux permease